MRLRKRRQRRDFAGVVHADLDHGKFRVCWHSSQRQRHAPVVVVARDRGMGLALPAQNRAQHLFGRCFAN